MELRDGVDSSGRKPKGKGVYQFVDKYGANVDGYSQNQPKKNNNFKIWKLEEKCFSAPERFSRNYQEIDTVILGPGAGAGAGCGIGLGIGLVGGLGFTSGPWNQLRLVFGLGCGCGVGAGFGYGHGLGYWSKAAMSCGTVTKNIAPCIAYLKGGSGPSAACCSGVKALNSLAATPADKKTACSCLKSAASSMKGLDQKKAAGLPGSCGGGVGQSSNSRNQIAPPNDSMTVAEHQVAKLMEEDMG
ncbi:IWF1': Non-specific lipid-transfer protein [Bienertia sinuspersici]